MCSIVSKAAEIQEDKGRILVGERFFNFLTLLANNLEIAKDIANTTITTCYEDACKGFRLTR